MAVVSEQQFIQGLGLAGQDFQRLYTSQTLAELLKIPPQRLRRWMDAGLIQPVKKEHGISYFDFRHASAAKTLCDLIDSGVTVGRLRKSLEQLKTWLPETDEPLRQLAMIDRHGPLLVRLDDGDLAEMDGQLHFEFTEDEPLPVMRIGGPRSASEWFNQGVEQAAGGFFSEAVESYRQALRAGGPQAQICFDLAHALAAQGKHEQAVERYQQAIEIDPNLADAYNNLGISLCELERREEAVEAFLRAVEINPADIRAQYNLADTLDELGRGAEAAPHWLAYVRQDPFSPAGAHARSRLSMA
jgi:tetratricopeptide (TPR) repeat protein